MASILERLAFLENKIEMIEKSLGDHGDLVRSLMETVGNSTPIVEDETMEEDDPDDWNEAEEDSIRYIIACYHNLSKHKKLKYYWTGVRWADVLLDAAQYRGYEKVANVFKVLNPPSKAWKMGAYDVNNL